MVVPRKQATVRFWVVAERLVAGIYGLGTVALGVALTLRARSYQAAVVPKMFPQSSRMGKDVRVDALWLP